VSSCRDGASDRLLQNGTGVSQCEGRREAAEPFDELLQFDSGIHQDLLAVFDRLVGCRPLDNRLHRRGVLRMAVNVGLELDRLGPILEGLARLAPFGCTHVGLLPSLTAIASAVIL